MFVISQNKKQIINSEQVFSWELCINDKENTASIAACRSGLEDDYVVAAWYEDISKGKLVFDNLRCALMRDDKMPFYMPERIWNRDDN